jgi:hypothetical protein
MREDAARGTAADRSVIPGASRECAADLAVALCLRGMDKFVYARLSVSDKVAESAIDDCGHGVRNRHSDNKKFCNDLNEPKHRKCQNGR